MRSGLISHDYAELMEHCFDFWNAIRRSWRAASQVAFDANATPVTGPMQ